jgi:hypothetical protein
MVYKNPPKKLIRETCALIRLKLFLEREVGIQHNFAIRELKKD